MAEQEAPGQAVGAPEAPARVHYLDTLCVLAVATVFVFHAFRPFNVTDWLVMNDETSPIAIAFEALVGPWGMPFFFLAIVTLLVRRVAPLRALVGMKAARAPQHRRT